MVSRFGFFSVLLLTLVFAMPAFESHACADEAPSSVIAVVADAGGDDAQCPDCGPACANGCCHAPHSAVPAEDHVYRAPAAFGHPQAWSSVAGRPLDRPNGPDRPPQL